MIDIKDNQKGFTLVEILVAMAIGLIVMGAIYSTYRTHSQSYVLQEQVAGMQQNLRAAMFYLSREIRMAGCDPTNNANARINTATAGSISFTCDIRGSAVGSIFDGDTNDPNENITYSLIDADGDGDNDIVRNTGGGNQLLAENIDALDFVYMNESFLNDTIDNDSDGTTDENDEHILAFPVNISFVKSVQISIVAKTGGVDPGYTNNDVFANQQGTQILAAQNDSFHRKMLTTNIRCRNL